MLFRSSTVAHAAAIGYPYNYDPQLKYCEETLTTTNANINWWLPSCTMAGGSSGGPWLQPISSGNGSVISVNSWGYARKPGMAGPKFNGTSAYCVYVAANFRP